MYLFGIKMDDDDDDVVKHFILELVLILFTLQLILISLDSHLN